MLVSLGAIFRYKNRNFVFILRNCYLRELAGIELVLKSGKALFLREGLKPGFLGTSG